MTQEDDPSLFPIMPQENAVRRLSTDESLAEALKGIDGMSLALGRRAAKPLVKRHRFEVTVHAVICLNAIAMGLGTWTSGEPPWGDVWDAVEHLFTAVFLFEMVLQIYFLRWNYFRDPWHVFDCMLVVVAVFCNWILALAVRQVTVLRAIRLLRFLPLLRVVKVRQDTLRLTEGIVAALHATLPTFMLLFLVIYAFSLPCIDILSGLSNLDLHTELYFGTLPRAWITLFNMAILAEWSEIVRPIFEKNPFYILPFVGFVMVCAFGIINVIIGIICERIAMVAQQERDEDLVRQQEEQVQHVKGLISQIRSLDADRDGVVSPEELEQEGCRQICASIGLPGGFSGPELHMMLDDEGTGEVSLQEFFTSMFRLIHGNDFQRSCLTQTALNHVKKLILESQSATAASMADLKKDVATLRQDILGELLSAKDAAREPIISDMMPQEISSSTEADILRKATQQLNEHLAGVLKMHANLFTELRTVWATAGESCAALPSSDAIAALKCDIGHLHNRLNSLSMHESLMDVGGASHVTASVGDEATLQPRWKQVVGRVDAATQSESLALEMNLPPPRPVRAALERRTFRLV